MAVFEIGARRYRVEGLAAEVMELLALHLSEVNGVDYGTVHVDCKPGRALLRIERTYPPLPLGSRREAVGSQ